ncbi:MAG: shikimate kinase [Vicinamibacterales bacterium]
MRICVLGNSGSGKSTYAKQFGVRVLELDSIYWQPHQIAVARDVESVRADLAAFIAANDEWVIEGCYADLIDEAARRCDELVFLNPGVDTCVANARRRPFEPHKYDRPEAQEEMLESLIGWIRAYATRRDSTGYTAHRRVFDAFSGPKREVRDLAALSSGDRFRPQGPSRRA